MRIYFRFIVYLFVAVASVSAHAGAYEDFFRAIDVDDTRTVQRLLERGMDPNSVSEQGQTALFLALRASSLQVADTLMKHPGLKPDQANGAGETALMMAALRGHIDAARRLVALGAAVQREGWAPLHYAATGPSTDLVRFLLERGAPLNARSPNGSTPLMMAARYGPESSVDLLLAQGADRTLRNERELDAADFARLEGREKLAARLAAPPR